MKNAKEAILETLRDYKPKSQDVEAFVRSVKEKEKGFRASTKAQTPSNEDRMRCYNL